MIKPHPVVALLTDFGLQDGYVGIMKGAILKINPSVQIVDLCHSAEPYDIFGAAYILSSAYRYFPSGTVHVAVVDPGVGSSRRIICLKTKDYIFLAPDNGILSLIAAHDNPEVITEVTNNEYFLPEISNTFHGRDIFAPVAAHLANGISALEFGKKISRIREIEIPVPVLSSNSVLTAEVIYIDRFGNIVTNIDSSVLEKIKFTANGKYADKINTIRGRFSIVIANRKIERISKSYSEVKNGELAALFGSSGYLEIAANKDSAKELLNVRKGDKIVVCTKKNR